MWVDPANVTEGSGLCLMRTLTIEEGGHIEVMSSVGQGATIRCRFFLAQTQADGRDPSRFLFSAGRKEVRRLAVESKECNEE